MRKAYPLFLPPLASYMLLRKMNFQGLALQSMDSLGRSVSSLDALAQIEGDRIRRVVRCDRCNRPRNLAPKS